MPWLLTLLQLCDVLTRGKISGRVVLLSSDPIAGQEVLIGVRNLHTMEFKDQLSWNLTWLKENSCTIQK